jgi:hypothetical protein
MSNRFPADDEHLHPYPGNLKHHKVDKEERRKLLCEMMKDDAKSGLYNEKKRHPLLRDSDLAVGIKTGVNRRMTLSEVRDYYEAARAKDAELIQQLMDEVAAWMQPDLDERFRGEQWHQSKRILDAAAAAGFKPSEP